MNALPSHGHLQYPVQFMQARQRRYQNPPPDHRTDPQQPNLQLNDFAGRIHEPTLPSATVPGNCPTLCGTLHTAQTAAALIRGHWQIENSLHWSLDVVMNDDQHRARKDHAPANFAALRRIALNIIKANPAKGSNRGKFKKAGWNNDFLKSLIQGF